jgi:hypothetical protein
MDFVPGALGNGSSRDAIGNDAQSVASHAAGGS